MLAAGKRSDGRWAYGESSDLNLSKVDRSYVGIIADHHHDLLYQVRDDETMR